MKNLKLNVLLGKTDYLSSVYKQLIKEYAKFFAGHQGAFQGGKSTYEAAEGTMDDPTKRKNNLVQTTVSEKLDWFVDNSKEYINALFSQEATNASGTVKADLVVDGNNWGPLTSFELLRLKSLIENSEFKKMLEEIPVRSDSTNWKETTNEAYKGRDIFETELIRSTNKTTEKESYILIDPNVAKLKNAGDYVPQTANKTTVTTLGEQTQQAFSGESTQRKKAEILQRRSMLLVAVIEALKKCNEAQVVESHLNSKKIFGYLFSDKT